MLTTENFKDSFYYIGPGFDFEPLFRFTNLCQTFIYANLWYTKDEVLNHLKNDLKNHPFLKIVSIKEYDDFDELVYFEMHPNYKAHFTNSLKGFTEQEKVLYFDAFKESPSGWMIEVNLIRKGLNRAIKLFYFTGEGLASYVALSHNGACPPKVLCTIQTEILERANGLMSRFLQQTNKLPFVWVRGVEPIGYRPMDLRDNVFSKDKFFSEIGMSFNFKWIINESYTTRNGSYSFRHCRAYLTKSTNEEIRDTTFKNFKKNKIHFKEIQEAVSEDTEIPKLIIITSRMRELFPQRVRDIEFLFWDDIFPSAKFNKISLQKSLAHLKEIDKNRVYKSMFFIPYGLEDEGHYLDKFLNKTYNSTMNAVVSKPLDLYDLRQPSISARREK